MEVRGIRGVACRLHKPTGLSPDSATVTVSGAKAVSADRDVSPSLRACDLFPSARKSASSFTLTLTLSLVREGEGIRITSQLSA